MRLATSLRSRILKLNVLLLFLVAALTLMTHLVHIPENEGQVFQTAPTARLFSDRSLRGSSLGNSKRVDRQDPQGSLPSEAKAANTRSWVTIASKQNGRFMWRGDGDAVLASANTEIALSERAWEVLDADPTLEFVALRFHSSSKPDLNGRLMKVGPPPEFAIILAPSGTSIQEHSVQFRVSSARTGPLLSRSTDAFVAVVDDRVAPFGTLRCHPDVTGRGLVGSVSQFLAPSRHSAFVLLETTGAEVASAAKEEDRVQRAEDERLKKEVEQLQELFKQEEEEDGHSSAAFSSYPHLIHHQYHPNNHRNDHSGHQLAAPKKKMKMIEKRVISFGLYGSDPKYISGALRNVQLAATYFPGWVCRFYHDASVPPHALHELQKLGAELVDMAEGGITGGIAGMFWRFLVADDPSVDRFIVRDSDSRLNARDAHAVAEWVSSNRSVHTIRDHPNHERPMNGGMWGAKKGFLDGAGLRMAESENAFWNSGSWWDDVWGSPEDKAQRLREAAEAKKVRKAEAEVKKHQVVTMQSLVEAHYDKEQYGADLNFLKDVVWPLVSHDALGHDAYSCAKFPGSAKGFPTMRPRDFQHVGQVFDASDQPRLSDIDGWIRGVEVPKECRRHPDWKYG